MTCLDVYYCKVEKISMLTLWLWLSTSFAASIDILCQWHHNICTFEFVCYTLLFVVCQMQSHVIKRYTVVWIFLFTDMKILNSRLSNLTCLLILSLMVLDRLAQHILMDNIWQKTFNNNLEKYLYVQGDLITNFYLSQFFLKYSFVYTITEIAKLPLNVLAI